MEPRIQYAKTSDGASIAYWTMGEGPPYVWLPGTAVVNIQGFWSLPTEREWFESLAARWTVVRYDRRGSGLSARDVGHFGLDALVLDVEAVVDQLALERFVVEGTLLSGPVAIAYAARHPERVSHVILQSSYASGAAFWKSPRARALRALSESDWDTYAEALARFYAPDAPVADTAAMLRESVTPEAHKAFIDATAEHDVTDLLRQVHCPTLVIHLTGSNPFAGIVGLDTVRELASGIPAATLVATEDAPATRRAIEDFLGEGEPSAGPLDLPAGAFRTVLFTDLVGHTEMMARLGDERGRAVLREHERITREVLRAHGGTEVKTMGDGFMASFGSVTKAVECGIALQRAFAEREGEPLQVRCGLNAGEPIEEEGDLFGATVILASRIAAKAEGGEILVANAVRELCSGKGFLFSDRGEFVAKGFEEPVRVYEVRWREEA